MDLVDAPDGMPLVSQQIVVKPENQADITKSNGSRNIRFLIPDYLGYWLPSQSNFTFDIKMKGRGLPIPSRDAGAHSLFQTIRSHDGTGTHLLEDVVHYNTFVAQKFNYTKTEASQSNRSEFQGVQANQSYDNNLYWALQGGQNWTNGTITDPLVPRNVQIVTPLQSKLYNNDEYIPCEALGGVRLELQMENFSRAIEYTTGSLGVQFDKSIDAVMPVPLTILENGSSKAAVGAQTKLDMFLYAGAGYVAGTGYVQNNLYSFSIGGVDCGYVKVLNAGPGVTEAELFCLGMTGATTSTRIPVAGDLITLSKQAPADTAAVLILNNGVNGSGDGSVGNHYQNVHLPLWDSTPAALGTTATAIGSAGSILSPPSTTTHFGDGTLRSPYRNVSRKASAAYNPGGCHPTTIMPFEVGDQIYISYLDGANPTGGCVLAGIDEYVSSTQSDTPRLLLRPDRPVVAGMVVGGPAPDKTTQAPSPRVWTGDYGFTHLMDGIQVYVKDSERMDGYTLTNIPTTAPEFQKLHDSAANTCDFTIADIQYQAQQVVLPESVRAADMAAANSEKGLQIDLQTIETRLVNQAAIQGPTSQLISIPNITRALSVLSVPLAQTEQRGLAYNSLRGVPDNLSTYQYELGQAGLVPTRPVPVEKASLGNPLVQAWEVNEKMKTMSSFDLVVSNLNHVGMNFAVGRQFSRPGMWFDLMRAGDLLLRGQYDLAQASPKLFVHFLNHIRSININRGGMEITN